MTLQPTEKLTVLQPHVQLADPHVASDNKNRLSILCAMYEALVRLDGMGNYRPSLAESWTVRDDACTWTFSLRGGVPFHNGETLQAADVVTSLERACDPTLGGDLGTEGLFQSYLKGAIIKVIDKRTVRIVTANPMADLLDLLVDIPVVPQTALIGLPNIPIGSGPYRLVKAQSDFIVMEAFDQYWAGVPPVGQIHWQAEPNASRRVEALLASEVDLISDVPLASRSVIKAAEQIELVVAPTSTCATFMCNTQSGVCQDRRVRQALNYAVDISEIVDQVMDGTARPLNGPLTDLHFGYNPSTPPYPYDPHRARELLARAGYVDNLRLVLDVPTVLPDEAVEVAQLMTKQYAKAGITTEIKKFSDRPAYANMVRAKQIDDACCFDSSPLSTFRPLRDKFHSGVRGPWWLGYTNPEVDALIDQAQATVDNKQRRQFYRQACQIIRDDAPWIFLYSPSAAWGVGIRVRGWRPGIDGVISLI